ncbi:MAG: segregation/condensation protein A [Candidatus Omnitrophica bacterium]|nr:segregation/condensation protein A [Candidatus Omnitrophota bacterium]
MRYDVEADLYEGPLPLLVELAKLRCIDIFLIKLVELTQAYLQRVKAVGIDLNQLAEPLPLLGNLVALKARGLLPAPPAAAEDEEVPISLEELERRLKEYEQFKTVAQLLAELHTLQHQHFGRVEADASVERGEPPSAPVEVGITDLMSAFARVLEKAAAPVYEVLTEPWTVEQKAQELRVTLTVRRQVRFLDLFTPEQSKLELVVTFLALLELIRQRVARAIQERPFADILIAAVAH